MSSPLEAKRRVERELNHISSQPGPQSLLRVMYKVHRLHSSWETEEGKESIDQTILMGCVEAIRERYRDFRPLYDEKFFG